MYHSVLKTRTDQSHYLGYRSSGKSAAGSESSTVRKKMCQEMHVLITVNVNTVLQGFLFDYGDCSLRRWILLSHLGHIGRLTP